MKKVLASILLASLALVGCGSAEQSVSEDGLVQIETLRVGFIPSIDPDEIVTVTEPLKGMLIEELAKEGFEVGEVEITVGTTYEIVGEGLEAGTLDIGLISGSTYVMYDSGAEVLLTSTRDGLSVTSDDPIDWNNNKPTVASTEQAVEYRSLIIAGPSEKGQELAAKVNAGEELTWEDVNSATWNVMSTTSAAGYVYPSLWLQDNFGKGVTDLSKAVIADSYGSAFARLAAGQTDVLVTYADARRDNADQWVSDFGREASIWDETNVIGVTAGIYNDTVSVSKNSKIMTEDLKEAIAKAFINISGTEEGLEVISIYNHKGYQRTQASDYDAERAAQQLIRELNQ